MGYVTEREIWVRSTDIDADGVVNNAHYFSYFEQARLDHLQSVGVIGPLDGSSERVRNFTIAENLCRYLAPAFHRDLLSVTAWTKSVGNRSFVQFYKIRRTGDGAVLAEGHTVHVWLGADGRPTPLDDNLRRRLVNSVVEDA